MDSIVSSIRKHSAENKAEELDKLVQKLDREEKQIKKAAGQVNQILKDGIVNSQQHGLGYVCLLAAKAQHTEVKNHIEFIEQARDVLMNGDGYQLRLGAKYVRVITRKLVGSLILAERLPKGITPLKRALEKVRGPRKHLLTAVHADLLLLYIKTRHYREAAALLETPLHEIDPKHDGIEPLDYLLFHYYAGIVYIALKDYDKALDFFLMALTVPTHILSAVQVEAYKRYILISLIQTGELVPLPSHTTSLTVSRLVDRLCPAYVDLAKAYKKGVASVQAVIEENLDIFTKDRTLGLVRQSVTALVRRNIQRLTNTYLTLSLKDIAEQADLNAHSHTDADKHVFNMIADGSIRARINQKAGMLEFLQDDQHYDDSQTASRVDKKIREVLALYDRLNTVNKDLLLNPLYVARTMPPDPKSAGGPIPVGFMHEDDDYALQMALAASKQ